MTYVHLTWYLLVDGTHADPNDVAPDKDGVLRHKNGLAVALHADATPQSVGRGAIENKNVLAAEVGEGDDGQRSTAEAARPASADLSPPRTHREIRTGKRGTKARGAKGA